MLIPNLLSSSGVQGLLNSANFYLPFYDSGAGAVNTAEYYGTTPTFTRATVAWTKLSTGLWVQVASGTARSFYSGATTVAGSYLGYLAEGAGTQLVTPTASIRDMTDASWIKVTMTTAFTSTGIAGVVNSATRLTATGATSTILQTLVAAASSRTYSVWLRRVTGSGTINIVQGATTLDVTASLNSSTYTRVELNASVLNAAFGIQIITSGDAIDADFNQFEAGAFATSPMDAAGAARNADVLTYPTTGWFDQAVGTFYSQFGPLFGNDSGLSRIIGSSGSAEAPIFIASTTTLGIYDGTQQALTGAGTNVTTAVTKGASAYGSTGIAVVMNGGTVATDPSYDGGIITTALSIGGGGVTEKCYGPIRRVAYWNSRLPNATLQALTA